MKTQKINNITRIREILSVIRKHHIQDGLTPVKTREMIEELGPTFIKLGQIMSMRNDLIPQEYCKELEKLRASIAPLSFSTIHSLIEEEIQRPLDEVFQDIDFHPIGSASIAQVHLAHLLDGQCVVLKVQRPHIHEIMEADVRILHKFPRLLKMITGTGDLIDYRSIIDELWQTSQTEMNFLNEAHNMDVFACHQKDIHYIEVPHVYHEYTTNHLLVYSYVDGIPIDECDKLTHLGYDLDEIALKMADNCCKQIFDDGFFHADPHPGNLLIDEGKIAWIDFGMMGTVSTYTQHILSMALQALIEDDIYDLEEAFLMLVTPDHEIDQVQLIGQLKGIVNEYKSKSLSDYNFSDLIQRCFDIVKSNEIVIPTELTLLCRCLVTLEGTLEKISPDTNLIEILINHKRNSMMQEIDFKDKSLKFGQDLYKTVKKSYALPQIIYDLIKMSKNGQLHMNMTESDDYRRLIYKKSQLSLIIQTIFSCFFMLCGAICTLRPMNPSFKNIPWISVIFFIIAFLLIIDIWIHLKKLKR